MRSYLGAFGAGLLLASGLGACVGDDPSTGSDPSGGNPDGSTGSVDASNADGQVPVGDGGPGTDADAASEEPPSPTPTVFSISTTGSDELHAVTYDTAGNIYAAGWKADSTDYVSVLVKLLPNGKLDPSFGTGGIATHNAVAGGRGEQMHGVVVQSTGKIVIGGTVEHDFAGRPADRDLALIRFNPNGSLDTGFGAGGVRTLSLSSPPASDIVDDCRGLYLAAGDKIVAAAARYNGSTHALAAVRFNADGTPDGTFATDGIVPIPGANFTHVLGGGISSDGSIFITGAAQQASPEIARGVVAKVKVSGTGAGSVANGFGTSGTYQENALEPGGPGSLFGGITLQGNKLVAGGYGNENEDNLKLLATRLDANGARDTTFASTTNGVARFTPNAAGGSTAQKIVALPDNRLLLVGQGGNQGFSNFDAVIGILTADGQPDTTFDPTGAKFFDLGGPDDGFSSAAVSPDQKRVAIVGNGSVGALKHSAIHIFQLP